METQIVVSTAAFDGYDYSVSLREISRLGVSLVEFAFIEGYTDPFTDDYFIEKNARAISSLLDENGLTCLGFSAHIDLSQEGATDRFSRRMDFAKSLGARFIISNAAPAERESRFMTNIAKLTKLADLLDIDIALENPGDGRSNILDRGAQAKRVIEKIGSDRVRMNYDFGNLISHLFEKVRPEIDYRDALPYISYFHIKDVASDEQGWHFTEIGKGEIDYRVVLNELKLLPERLPVSLEIPLRIRRGKDALPLRKSSPVELERIIEVLENSVRFVKDILDRT